MTVSTDSVLSDAVLQAARAAMPADLGPYYGLHHLWENSGPKNQPLLPLLDCLLDAAEAVTKAISDNAWDDGLPLQPEAAKYLAEICHRISDTITTAAEAHDSANWSLPSMSGKELV